ncbi:phage protein NinX family protein [Cedecea colo]|uniref:DUF2591 domain-containing protein n=1 Tax=Cedecea colo TaxID=2552946 RepID=A0ABX0VKS6_9ENTR|nr:phage protein NinX family protein [Cedecea colo]NIY47294.1 DUF2591 domain-containing protein [Cedecea colo]
MTDYSQMSDQQINGMVMDALSNGNQHHQNGKGDDIELLWQLNDVQFGEHVEYDEVYATFNPCNNPADAWPIIHDNLISINFDNDGYDTPQNAWCRATSLAGDKYYGDEKKPLRAAMILFLMMRDKDNAKP